MRSQPRLLNLHNPCHKTVAAILNSMLEAPSVRTLDLDTRLVDDLGLDPFRHGFLLSIEMEKAIPGISPQWLSFIEGNLSRAKVQDLIDAFGGLAWI